MRAHYADGRAALTHEITCEIGPDALTFTYAGAQHIWLYATLKRGDDDNGAVTLRRAPDTGERVVLSAEAAQALRSAAPSLFTPQARGVERKRVVAAIAAGAYAAAAAFLFGVPMAAGPIASVMPEPWRARVSDIAWSQVEELADYCDNSDEAGRILNDMAHRMMGAANVPDRDSIWIIIVDARDWLGQPIPNAFALPDGSVIVTQGLISLAEHPDELAGVIAHEIAHVERDHVMKNVISRIGAGVFFDIVFGGAGVGQTIAIASVGLAGLRYSRAYEAEADMRALTFLDAAGIDPGGFARMFDHLRAYESGEDAGDDDAADGPRVPNLLSTHPDTAARAERARARARPGLAPALSAEDWRIVRRACAVMPPAQTSEISGENGAVGED